MESMPQTAEIVKGVRRVFWQRIESFGVGRDVVVEMMPDDYRLV